MSYPNAQKLAKITHDQQEDISTTFSFFNTRNFFPPCRERGFNACFRAAGY